MLRQITVESNTHGLMPMVGAALCMARRAGSIPVMSSNIAKHNPARVGHAWEGTTQPDPSSRQV